jgi:hypothetical protein
LGLARQPAELFSQTRGNVASIEIVAYLLRKHVALAVGIGVILSMIVQVIGFQLGYRQHLDWISASLPGRIDEFLLGMLAAHL